MVYNGKSNYLMDDFGVPLFLETSICFLNFDLPVFLGYWVAQWEPFRLDLPWTPTPPLKHRSVTAGWSEVDLKKNEEWWWWNDYCILVLSGLKPPTRFPLALWNQYDCYQNAGTFLEQSFWVVATISVVSARFDHHRPTEKECPFQKVGSIFV